MPRGTHLSLQEQAEIGAYKKAGWSNRAIAKQLKRSNGCINNFVNDPLHYVNSTKTGAPQKLSQKEKMMIVSRASTSMKSIRELTSELNLSVSKNTVWRVLKNESNLVRAGKKSCCTDKTPREHNIPSDERKINLDPALDNGCSEEDRAIIPLEDDNLNSEPCKLDENQNFLCHPTQ